MQRARPNRQPCVPSGGFTLTELLVSLAIGVFLLAGVISTVMATRETNKRKAELEAAMEAFRFAAYAVTRQIRQADAVVTGSGSASLTLQMPEGGENCGGGIIPSGNAASRQTVITVASGSLTCKTGTAAALPLVYGVKTATFAYGIDANGDKRIAASEYTTAPADAATATSIQVSLTLEGPVAAGGTIQDGITQTFIATLRRKALGG